MFLYKHFNITDIYEESLIKRIKNYQTLNIFLNDNYKYIYIYLIQYEFISVWINKNIQWYWEQNTERY